MKPAIVGLLLTACLSGGSLSPAGKAIDNARAAILKDPGNAAHHNALALALARRARETADPGYYDQAAQALAKSLELSPDNMTALKLQCWVLLGKHRFAEALKAAEALRKRTGDDEMIYGLLTDAHVELGNYEAAEDAAQWMLNTGRSSVPGLTRAAFLRELFGDIEGALDLLHQAFQRTRPEESEDRAWILTQIGHLLTATGKIGDAATVLDQALELMPGYHYALAALAKVRTAEGRHDDAVQLLRTRYESAPHPENLFDLGAALHRAGRIAESKKVLADFERKALAESENEDNANRELVAYYADYAGKPREALRIAQIEIGRRHDVLTLDALAWALHKSGRSQDALPYIERALAAGTVDARILYHAGAISKAAGRTAAARKYFEKGLEVNPRSEVAGEARRLLSTIPASSQSETVAATR